MSRSDWDDDEQSNPAPLPAHEREWRHPSEFGHQQWLHTEPPLTIGRGLTAATGAVGGLLALAVLWTMLPTQAGRSAGNSVRSTLATRATAGLSTELLAGTGEFDAPPATKAATSTTTPAVLTTRPPSNSQANVATTSTPVSQRPLGTYSVGTVDELEPGAIAVAVNGGSLVITTANAVSADLTVDLLLPDGSTEQARVLFVDTRSGLAVLAPETVSGIPAFTVGTSIVAGDELTFLGSTNSTVVVSDDLAIDAGWADAADAEGTPVINQRGELVALCTHDADGTAKLVPLANLDEMQQAIATYQDRTKVWLGIMLNDDPSGEVMVGAVDPAGPAGVAGMAVGDLILAVDGVAIASTEELATALGEHASGDVVLLSVQRSSGVVEELSITLGSPRAAL